MLSLIFGQTDYTDKTFRQQTIHLEFLYHKEKTVGDFKLLACDGKVLLKSKAGAKVKKVFGP